MTLQVGDYTQLRYMGVRVRVEALLPNGRALVSWSTAGKRHGRYWLKPPQRRERVVRLSSLGDA